VDKGLGRIGCTLDYCGFLRGGPLTIPLTYCAITGVWNMKKLHCVFIYTAIGDRFYSG
jgi:hypothetical protein